MGIFCARCKKVWALCFLFLTQLIFNAQASSEELKIFIIPHSHCDPGWLNTFDGYFQQSVNKILTNVVNELSSDPKKKFSWAEQSFFSLWWERQNSDTRDQVRRLVKNKQFEFIAGGWVQNDEANANFDIVIDQVTEGHDYILKNFGSDAVPKVAWQIDPFGHSSLTPSLFARMGFQGLVINRIHHSLKSAFKENKQMEFEWRGSKTLQDKSSILTHVLHTHYSAPPGFDWEESSIQINQGNVEMRSRDLVRSMKARAVAYKTKNLLVPFGDDFKFQNANLQFSNMDQIIAFINSRSGELGASISYATVGEYFDALFEEAKRNSIRFPIYEGDFFPYADNDDSYWTGYYSTRPTLKTLSRSADSVIRSAEIAYAFARSHQSNSTLPKPRWIDLFKQLQQSRRDAALVQHHDGITGTAKQFVANDYANRLDNAVKASEQIISTMIPILLSKDGEAPQLSIEDKFFEFPLNSNQPFSYSLIFYNSLGWTFRQCVHITVSHPNIRIRDSSGNDLKLQTTKHWGTVLPTHSSAFQRTYRAYFFIEVPALGCNTYFLSERGLDEIPLEINSNIVLYGKNLQGFTTDDEYVKFPENNTIENKHIAINFNRETGFIESIQNKALGKTIKLNQQILDYSTRRSGAYIFRTDGNRAFPIYSPSNPVKIHVSRGDLVQEAILFLYNGNQNSAAETVMHVRLYTKPEDPDKTIFAVEKNTDTEIEIGYFVEVKYSIVGRGNKETIVRYETDMKNGGKFNTDNGLEIRQRSFADARPEQTYYPSLSAAYLVDQEAGIQFTLLSRRAMGTGSVGEGSIEQMMHRNLNQDDGRGLSEPNNDNSRVQVHTQILLHIPSVSTKLYRKAALMLQHPTRLLYSLTSSPHDWSSSYLDTFSPLSFPLPLNLHLLSLKARDGFSDELVIRWVHTFESEQDSEYSSEIPVDLSSVFQGFTVSSVRERSLALSLSVPEMQARISNSLQKICCRDEPRREKVYHESGVPVSFKSQQKGESQNTEEEGVFISQAALEEKQKNEIKHDPNRKRSIAEDLQPQPQTRTLLYDLTPFEFKLNPMDIKSFFITLQPGGVLSSDQSPIVNAEGGEEEEEEKETPQTDGSSPVQNSEESEIKQDVNPPKNYDDTKTEDPEPRIEADFLPEFVQMRTKENVGELEFRLLLVVSVICTILVVGAYFKIGSRSRRKSEKNDAIPPKKKVSMV